MEKLTEKYITEKLSRINGDDFEYLVGFNSGYKRKAIWHQSGIFNIMLNIGTPIADKIPCYSVSEVVEKYNLIKL